MASNDLEKQFNSVEQQFIRECIVYINYWYEKDYTLIPLDTNNLKILCAIWEGLDINIRQVISIRTNSGTIFDGNAYADALYRAGNERQAAKLGLNNFTLSNDYRDIITEYINEKVYEQVQCLQQGVDYYASFNINTISKELGLRGVLLEPATLHGVTSILNKKLEEELNKAQQPIGFGDSHFGF